MIQVILNVVGIGAKQPTTIVAESPLASSLSDLGSENFLNMIEQDGGRRVSKYAWLHDSSTMDYDTPLILPPNLRDWVPAGHLAHFILDAVEELDLRPVRVNERGTGSEQYPPRMLLALLLYCYATGVFSSRRIEQASSGQRAGADDLRGYPSRPRHHLHLSAGEPSAVARDLCAGAGTGPGA